MARRTVLTHDFGFTAQDIAEDDMNRMSDQLTFSDQSGRSARTAGRRAAGDRMG